MSCKHCGGENIFRVRTIMVSGDAHVWDKCDDCGKNANGNGHYLPKSLVGNPAQYPIEEDYSRLNPSCEHCGAIGTHLHHFAPKHIFGDEDAWKWPQAYLCPNCHMKWHNVIAKHLANCTTCHRLYRVFADELSKTGT